MLPASMPHQTGPERSRVCRLGDLPAVIGGQRVQDEVEGARHGRKWRKVNNFPRAVTTCSLFLPAVDLFIAPFGMREVSTRRPAR